MQSYYGALALPGSCSSDDLVFLCNVAAFNEKGEGPSSESVPIRLQCVEDGESTVILCNG